MRRREFIWARRVSKALKGFLYPTGKIFLSPSLSVCAEKRSYKVPRWFLSLSASVYMYGPVHQYKSTSHEPESENPPSIRSRLLLRYKLYNLHRESTVWRFL